MAHPKHTDGKQHERNVGRDLHSAKDKQVRDVKEGSKSDHKGKSDK
jgi:hypothetical protein